MFAPHDLDAAALDLLPEEVICPTCYLTYHRDLDACPAICAESSKEPSE